MKLMADPRLIARYYQGLVWLALFSLNFHVTYSTLLNHIEGDLNSLYVCIC